MKVLVITGYKATELGVFSEKHQAIPYIKKILKQKLIPLLEDGLEWVVISGQLGVELWAADVVFDLQLDYPFLQLGVFTPFLDQEENWNEQNKLLYEEVLMNADHVDSITKRKYDSPQQFRLKNQFLVDKSDGILIVYDEEKDGSPKYIVQTAKNKANVGDYWMNTITFSDIESMMEEEQWNDYRE